MKFAKEFVGAYRSANGLKRDNAKGMTTSEQRFLEYCCGRGYAVHAIPTEPKTRKTADFRVQAGGTTVLVEVKELTANEEDECIHSEMKSRGSASGGSIVGCRARGLIREAAEQLKAHKAESLPSVVVLYDNIVLDGKRQPFPYTDLATFQIDAAMYGLVQATLVLGDGRFVGFKPDRAGPSRTTTASEKLYLSAVCVLYDTPQLWMLTYHNYYAAPALPFNVFTGQSDAHLRKPGDPNRCPGAWEKAC